MFCSNCGAEAEGNFCKNCGAPLPKEEPSTEKRNIRYMMRKKTRNKKTNRKM